MNVLIQTQTYLYDQVQDVRKASNTGMLAFELRENSPQLIDKSVVIGRIVSNKCPNLKIRIGLINLIVDDM